MDLEKTITQKLHKQVITFFMEHPASVETQEGISLWTGLAREKIAKILTDLVRCKIVISDKTCSPKSYAFTHDSKLIRQICGLLGKKKAKK